MAKEMRELHGTDPLCLERGIGCGGNVSVDDVVFGGTVTRIPLAVPHQGIPSVSDVVRVAQMEGVMSVVGVWSVDPIELDPWAVK